MFVRSYSRIPSASAASSFKRPSTKRILPKPTQSPLTNPPPSQPFIAVNIPRDTQNSVLKNNHESSQVLAHPLVMIGRQLEMLNVFLGYEQANKYAIKDQTGNDVGFIAEEAQSFLGTILRQLLRTRRKFSAVVLDPSGNTVLKIERPIKWFLNSTISVLDSNDNLIGEAKQNDQFAIIDGPILTWDFFIKDDQHRNLASVNKNLTGLMRELFTDSSSYAIHFDAVHEPSRHLSMDERAIVLATAITIDIDYFSRHSNSHGGFLPFVSHGGGELTSGGIQAPIPVIIPGVSIPYPDSNSETTPQNSTPLSSEPSNISSSPFLADEPSYQEDDTFLPDDAPNGGGSIFDIFDDD